MPAGPPRPYTVNDTPAVVARVGSDLRTVKDAVVAADPHLRSLVLTGGFARGEGAMLDGRPQNDYDFVAVRGTIRPSRAYAPLAKKLERDLGLHIDLAPVAVRRLAHTPASIFWYETALRGRVLWGEDLLASIRVRRPEDLQPTEGLRLLVNRAAGLLLYTRGSDHEKRIQAAKALLAAMDAHLLAMGIFPPSQTERWDAVTSLGARGPPAVSARALDFGWAYGFKVDPGHTEGRAAGDVWKAAREAILEAVPVALRHAGMKDLDEYARQDGVADHLVYALRAGKAKGRRLRMNPTGRVRVATLRLLEATPDGDIDEKVAGELLAPMVQRAGDPVAQLEALRSATLQ